MVLTPSTMKELGTPIPDFELENLEGSIVTPRNFEEKKGLLVMFISKHCPYVQHILEELTRLSQDYKDSDLGMVAISSNDVENYPDDSAENLRKMANENGLEFSICLDESQEVAKNFQASCTPDFFLYDAEGVLVYRGQLDDSRPGNNQPVNGRDLRKAIEAILAGRNPEPEQKPSIGCNIKWKRGNEPEYFQ